MENKLTVFENNKFGKVRVKNIDGEPFFIAKDICEILGLQNVSETIKRIDDDELSTTDVIDTIGRKQKVYAVNESGLYNLIFQSRKPEARTFKKWVTAEVLPSIRKNGMYAKEELLDNPDMLLSIVQKLKEEKDKRQALEEKIEADKEKVMLAEAIETNKASIMIKDLAMILMNNGINIGQNRLFAALRENGFLCKEGRYKNKPTQRSLELKIMECKEYSIKQSSGFETLTFVPLITGKGQGYFVKYFLDRKNNI